MLFVGYSIVLMARGYPAMTVCLLELDPRVGKLARSQKS